MVEKWLKRGRKEVVTVVVKMRGEERKGEEGRGDESREDEIRRGEEMRRRSEKVWRERREFQEG